MVSNFISAVITFLGEHSKDALDIGLLVIWVLLAVFSIYVKLFWRRDTNPFNERPYKSVVKKTTPVEGIFFKSSDFQKR